MICRCLPLLFAAALAAQAQAQADPVAVTKQIFAQTGITHGICAVPRAGDGRLALALAQQSELLVHASFTDAASLAAMCAAADKAGILGRTLYAEAGRPAALPYADDYVNLLVLLTEADVAQVTTQEILRVLTPQTGVAVMAGTGKVVLTKPAQPGAADWTHRLYDAANNPVSPDTTAWPLMTQWLGMPLLSQQPLVVAAGGRMASVHLLRFGSEAFLVMQDVNNGQVLWRRDLPNSAVATRTSGLVLTPTALYLTEGSDVIVYDPATGAETGRIAAKDLECAGQVDCAHRTHAVCHGRANRNEGSSASDVEILLEEAGEPWPRHRAGAFDLTVRWLWTQKETSPILDEGYVGVRDGRVYFLAHGKHLACVDAATGTPVWTSPKVAEEVARFADGDIRGHIGALLCTGKYLGIIQPGRGCWSYPPPTANGSGRPRRLRWCFGTTCF